MAIYSGFSDWKWWFSIVMLVYQRVAFLSGDFKQQIWNFDQESFAFSVIAAQFLIHIKALHLQLDLL